MTIRVLHFYRTYYPDSFGGIERVIHAIATATRPLGVETTVLSLSRRPKENSVDFDGHRAQKARLDLEISSTGMSLQAVLTFRRLARDADLIHFHFPWPYMDVVHLLSGTDRPYLITYHSDIVRQKALYFLYRPLMRRFLAKADKLVATSPNYAQSSPVLRACENNVAIIPIGLHDANARVDAAIRKRWRAELPKRFFLFVGQFRHYKGMASLMQAARLSGEAIVAIGGGPGAAEWIAKARQLNLSNMRFLGELSDPDKFAILSLCTAFVLPSDNRAEAFGLALLEAAMFAKPMISCEIGTGTSFVNVDGVTGIVVRPSDPEALAGAMSSLAANTGLANKLGKAARQRYLAKFTAERMGGEYARLYRELVDARKS